MARDSAGSAPLDNPVRHLFGLAVLGTALGVAAATFRGDGTALNAYFFLTLEWSHATSGRVERLIVTLAVTFALAAWLRPNWPAFLFVGAYALAEALTRCYERGQPYSEWALWAHAPRYLTPLGVCLVVAGVRRGVTAGAGRAWVLSGEALLRGGLAIVFSVHGLEAWRAHPGFVDLILSSAYRVGEWRIPEAVATQSLRIIGIVDLVVAVAILVRPLRVVLLWAAFWGVVTAFARITAYGPAFYPDFLVRFPHFTVPLALWRMTVLTATHTPGRQSASSSSHPSTA